MAKTADTIAIYSRKSRYTGKGESIGNQIDLCREYIRTHCGDAAAEHTVVFEDEGFSGGNLNRPDFKKMMTAAKDRKFKAIVVYRLDRISRNISDFSSLIEELGRLGIKTKTGRSFTRFSIKFILQNPVHLIAFPPTPAGALKMRSGCSSAGTAKPAGPSRCRKRWNQMVTLR